MYSTAEDTRDKLQKGLEAVKEDMQKATEHIREEASKLTNMLETAAAITDNGPGVPTGEQ